MFRYITKVILILLVSCALSFAHENGLGDYVMKAYRLDNVSPPKIDGKLDDSAWKIATPVSGFIQSDPNPGEPATKDTQAFFVYDRYNLYLGFRCYDDQPDKIINRLGRRGQAYLSDTIAVFLDPYHDHRTGYKFETTPGGVKADSYRFDDSEADWSWDGRWWSEGKINEKGWTAEFKIPFSNLRFKGDRQQIWGINFQRVVRRNEEKSSWKPMLLEGGIARMSGLGHLVGLKSITSGKHLEVYPYTLAGSSKSSDENIGKEFDTGFDIQYNLKNTLRTHFTLNPDFAQVEADQLEINLTRYPTRFKEKRPFFVEGNTVFSMPLELFYSRRIGSRGDILWGAKMTGKLRDYTFGFISSQTGSWDYFGLKESDENKESALYSVLRLKKDLFSRSNVGVLWTDKEMNEDYSRVVGLDGRFGFSESYRVSTLLAKSWSPSATEESRVFRILASQNSDKWNAHLQLERMEPEFNVNQTGFIYKEDHKGWQEAVFRAEYTPRVKKIGLRQVFFGAVASFQRNLFTDIYFHSWKENHPELILSPEFKRDLIAWDSRVWISLFFQKWLRWVYLSATRSREVEMTDVFNANRLNFFLSTDWSRPISGKFSFSGGDFYNFSQQYVGTQRRVSLSGILSQHKLRSEISGSYAQTFDPKKEVDGRFFTGSLRVTYFFTKALFLRAFAQTGFSRTYYDKTSTNKRYFISTLLGWEYSPKSHFFIAYNEDWRSSEEKLKLDDRVIVVKVSYLWNL